MMPTGRRRRLLLPVGVAALGCAACCAGPIVGLLGGITAASAMGAVFVPPLVVLAVLAAAATAVLLVRRRWTPSVAVGNEPRGTVDLGLPGAAGESESTTQVRR